MRVVAIIQARMGSTRLPGKVLLPIAGKPMLWHVVERCRWAGRVDDVVVATSTNGEDDAIREFARLNDVPVFSGSETDVLDRYYRAALEHDAEAIVRVTADCPLVDPAIVDAVVEAFQEDGYDHVGATSGSGARALGLTGYPEGAGASCFSLDALARTWREATEPDDREHVATYMLRDQGTFRCLYLCPKRDLSHLRWTVDNPEDLRMVRALYDAMYEPGRSVDAAEVIAFLENHEQIATMNSQLVGREKYAHIWEDLEPPDNVRIVNLP